MPTTIWDSVNKVLSKQDEGVAYILVAPLSFPGITYIWYDHQYHTTQRTLISHHTLYSKLALAQELMKALLGVNDKLTRQKFL